MAETLGSLIDKLTIVKLKQYHSSDSARLSSLENQQVNLAEEIDALVADAVAGRRSVDSLVFDANKVHAMKETIAVSTGTMGFLSGDLARINCELWHEQEKVYEFEKVQNSEKDSVVKRLGILNLERNKCIDAIDKLFVEILVGKN